MFLNSLKDFISNIFPKKNINYQKIDKLIENRQLYFSKLNLIYFLPYQNQSIKELFIGLKFRKKFYNSKIFAQILYDNLPNILQDLAISQNFNNPVLIPIPISVWRKFSRGYDQNQLILKEFSKLGGKNFIQINYNILKKYKHTKPQSKTKNKSERIKNIKNAFKIKNPEKIKNKNIILFDDIYTTGSTLNEARKILKKAGAKKVIFLTMAH